MSSISEQQKIQYMQQLATFRGNILKSTDSCAMRQEVGALEEMVNQLKGASTGDLQLVVQTTLEKIQKFQMHDTTRFEVCRWVQTIIYELNQL